MSQGGGGEGGDPCRKTERVRKKRKNNTVGLAGGTGKQAQAAARRMTLPQDPQEKGSPNKAP